MQRIAIQPQCACVFLIAVLLWVCLRVEIATKDRDRFVASYKQMLESCYACHVIAGKPFLRLQVPQQPEATISNFAAAP